MLKYVTIAACILATAAPAQDKNFTLNTPSEIADTGFLQHLLPRFSLKTGVRIKPVDSAADAAFGPQGTPVFRLGETVWRFSQSDDADADVFLKWLLSDVGKRTIEAFAPNGEPMFSADVRIVKVKKATELTGDLVLGERISLSKCGRCHVVNDSNKMNAIGSSPSFRLMRTFSDWQERFETFFMLKPHPSFTQVEDVTEPFAAHLPSPIAPIEVTLDQIEAITAYVGSIAPADLGAPIKSQ